MEMGKGIFKNHSKEMLLKRCTLLKQSDGEGWIIGDFVEKYINGEIKIVNEERQKKLERINGYSI